MSSHCRGCLFIYLLPKHKLENNNLSGLTCKSFNCCRTISALMTGISCDRTARSRMRCISADISATSLWKRSETLRASCSRIARWRHRATAAVCIATASERRLRTSESTGTRWKTRHDEIMCIVGGSRYYTPILHTQVYIFEFRHNAAKNNRQELYLFEVRHETAKTIDMSTIKTKEIISQPLRVSKARVNPGKKTQLQT